MPYPNDIRPLVIRFFDRADLLGVPVLLFILVVAPILLSGEVEPLFWPLVSALLGWLIDVAILLLLGVVGGPLLTRRVMAPAFVAMSSDPVEFGSRSMTLWLHPAALGTKAPREAMEVPYEKVQQLRRGGFLPPLVGWKVDPPPSKGRPSTPTRSTVLTHENMLRFLESCERWKASMKVEQPLS